MAGFDGLGQVLGQLTAVVAGGFVGFGLAFWVLAGWLFRPLDREA